jgi:hypothetical protein
MLRPLAKRQMIIHYCHSTPLTNQLSCISFSHDEYYKYLNPSRALHEIVAQSIDPAVG